MICTGAVATLSATGVFLGSVGSRTVRWDVSTAFFIALLYFPFGTLTEGAKRLSDDARSTFDALGNPVIAVRLVYPVWLIVGTERVGVIGLCPETAGVTLLDFVAKVGLGIVLLSSRDVFDDAGTGAGTTGQATVDWTGWNADRVSVDRLFDPTEQPRPWRSNGTRRSGRMLKIFTESNRNKDYPRGTAPIHGDTGCGCQAVSRVGRSMQTIIKYEYLDTSSATGEWKTEPIQLCHNMKSR
jgi:hypothetical protein